MTEQGTGVLILAAGKGTRMKSETPKVLISLLEEPILYYPMTSTDSQDFSGRAVVIGHGSEMVSRYLDEAWPGTEVIVQKEQLGTGHAVMTARSGFHGLSMFWSFREMFPSLAGIPFTI